MTILRIKRGLECCGQPVSRKYSPSAEVWDRIDYDLYKCDKCGKEDFAEAFETMELVNNILPCHHCNEQTKQELEYFDWFGGFAETTCTKCKEKVTHAPTEEEIRKAREEREKEIERLTEWWDD